MRLTLRACLAALVLAAPLIARAETVWSIGTPDGSYADLAIAANYGAYAARFGQGVTHTVGQDARQGWPFIQPGPVDAWAGSKSHTFRVRFALPEAPRGAYRLKLHLLGAHNAVPPVVEARVNGTRVGGAQLAPGPGDHLLTSPAAGQRSVAAFTFLAGRLRAGANEVAIATRAGSWLLYDAVTLEAGPEIPAKPVLERAAAHGTPFFRRVGGQMRQAIAVEVHNAGVEGPLEVAITGAAQQTARLMVQPGANLLHVLAPPVRVPGTARVTLRAGGRETTVDAAVRPERMWRIYLVAAAHTDIGYTNLQPATIAGHNANTALALRRMRTDAAMIWNLEVGWQERAFLSGLDDPTTAPSARKVSAADAAELRRRLREGRMGLPGFYLNMLTGLCDGEELARVVGWPVQAGLGHGVTVTAAHLTDVPSAVGTLPMLLRQAGVRYFVEGMNQSHGPVFRLATRPPYQAAFWWEALDGSRVLAHFADGYAQGSSLGMARGPNAMAAILPGWLRGFDRPDYLPDAVLAYGAFSDNVGLDPAYSGHVRAWNAAWDYPRIVQARAEDYFRYVEKGWGTRLQVLRGDMGVWWEDGAASSARETGLARWARGQLDASQRRLALQAARGGPSAWPAAALRAAWENVMLFNEHTWGAHNSFSEPHAEFVRRQWDWKARRAQDAARAADRLKPPAAAGARAGARVAVRNEHSWARDVLASAPAPAGAGPVCVVDVASGRVLPAQRSGRRAVFMAQGVPAMGYRTYVVRPARAAAPALAAAMQPEGAWQTPRWRLRIDPRTGGIASLVDRRTGQEWVRPGERTLNQYLWVRGGENSRVIEPHYPAPDLKLATHSAAQVRLVENGPVRAVIAVRRTGAGIVPVDTWVELDSAGRIRLVNVVRQDEKGGKVAGYFAFPFALPGAAPIKGYVELPYGTVQVDAEQMPGACRDWHTSAGFAALTDGARTACLVTPHAPCVTFNDIVRGLWRDRYEPLNGDLYSYALSHYWYTNYRYSQPGPIVLEYALVAGDGAFDPVAATRASWDALACAADPRRAERADVWDTARPAEPAPGAGPAARSLLSATGGPVVGGLEWRDGRLQVRLYNPAHTAATARLEADGWQVRSARATDLVGRPRGALAVTAGRVVTARVPARGIATVELSPAAGRGRNR